MDKKRLLALGHYKGKPVYQCDHDELLELIEQLQRNERPNEYLDPFQRAEALFSKGVEQ